MDVKPLYLNGKFVTGGEPVQVVNPATEEVFARVATVDRVAVKQAISDASKAFASWRKLTGKARGLYLRKIADVIERRKDEFARTMTLENGKPLAQSAGEVAMTIDHLQWFAEEARRAYGRIIPPQVDGKRHMVIKSPVGVVGAISPWNFPLVLAVRKVAPALAAGCTAILKPASATPLSSVLFAEAVHEAGLPAGVFQLVLGDAKAIAAEFLENFACRKITFTGSTAVGKELIRGAAAQVKKLSLELGGHAPVMVFEDVNIDKAVEGVLAAKFRNTGQSCIAANRVYVQRSIYDRFVARLVERCRQVKVGNGLEPGMDIGPVINQRALDGALKQIDDAVKRGGRVLCGGKRLGTKGFFLEPTIIADVPDSAVCMMEETFAPIAPVAAFDTEEQAIAMANSTPFGLAGYIFTENVNRAWRVAEQLEAGTIGLNDGVPSTSQAPFGGMKESGWGRELGSEGLEAFLETKHVSIGGVDA